MARQVSAKNVFLVEQAEHVERQEQGKGRHKYEPSAKDVARHIITLPKYIGWRTSRYGPLEITFWPGTTCLVREAKRLTAKTQSINSSPARTSLGEAP